MKLSTAIILLLLLGLIIIVSYMAIVAARIEQKIEAMNEVKPMQRLGEDYEADNITGLHIPGCAYVVDIRGRRYEAINKTNYHEAARALVREDRPHYCGGKE